MVQAYGCKGRLRERSGEMRECFVVILAEDFTDAAKKAVAHYTELNSLGNGCSYFLYSVEYLGAILPAHLGLDLTEKEEKQ